MRTICALMLLVASAAAQETLEFNFYEWSGTNSVNITSMATVSEDGEAKINWALVEKVAADKRLDHSTNMARLMLAIRDKTYKELR